MEQFLKILWPLSDIVSWCVTKYISGHRLQLPFGTIVLCSSHRFGGQTISYILCTRYTSLFYFILCVYYPTWQPAQRETCVCARAVRLQRHPLPSLQFFALLCNILSHEIVIYLFLTNYPIKIHFNRIDCSIRSKPNGPTVNAVYFTSSISSEE